MSGIFAFVDTGRSRTQEANLVQTKFLVGWGGLLCFAIFASALGSAIGQVDWTHSFQTFFQVLAIGIVVAGASAMMAWLLGLLFGIPRSIANAGQPAAPAPGPGPNPPASAAMAGLAQSTASRPTLRVNTNLEDISDWLTKTLIGVGLTQLGSLPHKLWEYATIMDQASLKAQGGGAVFILSIALAGAAGGFWVGYVTTRTLLTQLFSLFDRSNLGDVSAAADPENLTLGADQKPVASADPAVRAADEKLRGVSLHVLSAPTDIAAWGAAQARAMNLGNALQAVRQAAATDPNNADIKALLSKVEQASNPGGNS